MKVFAVSDLHLSFVGPPQGGLGPMAKPREVFGGHWQDCYARLCENWRRVVGEDDAVLVAGDISWAMTLEDCGHDFAFLAELPGR
ncbi:MAG: phosphohydrolase, partial [Clostridiales bacterium]|nr:phosphohydrolase [Clostridiales bacterium]